MKKLLLAAALVVVSAGVQAQSMSEENRLLLQACTSDNSDEHAFCRGLMVGVKMGIVNEFTNKWEREEGSGTVEFHESIARRVSRISHDELVLAYIESLRKNPGFQQVSADVALYHSLYKLIRDQRR